MRDFVSVRMTVMQIDFLRLTNWEKSPATHLYPTRILYEFGFTLEKSSQIFFYQYSVPSKLCVLHSWAVLSTVSIMDKYGHYRVIPT